MSDTTQTPDTDAPAAAASQPAGPIVLGEMTPEEMGRLQGFKAQADQTVHQIGVNRVQEHRLMQQLGRLENSTNQVIQEAGARLAIPDGTAWSVTGDGKAILVGTPPPAQPPKAKPTLVPVPEAGQADETPPEG